MTRFFQLLFLLLVAFGRAESASAQTVGDAQRSVVRLENEWTQLETGRVRLERESGALAVEIEKVKAEPAGVRRDFQLRELLASAKTKADELTRVAGELRVRTSALGDARRQLIVQCDRALLQPTLNEAKRLELARLRTAQAALLAMPMAPLGKVMPVAVDPLDGPRELKEKADLLRDSGDKLKREVARLAARIDDVERRRHLRERAGAVDEDLFGESASNRRFARSSTGAQTTAGGNRGTANENKGNSDAVATPNTPSAPSGGFNNPPPSGQAEAPSNASGGGGSNNYVPRTDATVLRNLVDPSTLDELRRADGGDDLDRQVRALKRAQGELEGLAAELERRAKSLSHRAEELKRQK